MRFEDLAYTSSPIQDNPSVLKVSIPKGEYDSKEIEDLRENVKKQVGNAYLVITVPKDIDLEIIV